jgi:hypothetical protein
MLTRDISERWPGINFRLACQRWLAGGGKPKKLAAELHMEVETFLAWINDNDRAYVVPVNATALDVLHKYNKKEKNKKRGPKPKDNSERVQAIKEYGAHEYANQLVSGYQRAVGPTSPTPDDA